MRTSSARKPMTRESRLGLRHQPQLRPLKLTVEQRLRLYNKILRASLQLVVAASTRLQKAKEVLECARRSLETAQHNAVAAGPDMTEDHIRLLQMCRVIHEEAKSAVDCEQSQYDYAIQTGGFQAKRCEEEEGDLVEAVEEADAVVDAEALDEEAAKVAQQADQETTGDHGNEAEVLCESPEERQTRLKCVEERN